MEPQFGQAPPILRTKYRTGSAVLRDFKPFAVVDVLSAMLNVATRGRVEQGVSAGRGYFQLHNQQKKIGQ